MADKKEGSSFNFKPSEELSIWVVVDDEELFDHLKIECFDLKVLVY